MAPLRLSTTGIFISIHPRQGEVEPQHADRNPSNAWLRFGADTGPAVTLFLDPVVIADIRAALDVVEGWLTAEPR